MRAETVPFVCLLLAGLLIYLPRLFVIVAQIREPGGLDNAYPRAQQARLVGFGARANGAHANSFEAFGMFAVGVLASRAAGVDPQLVAGLAMVHVAARAVYVGMYLGNLPTLRTAIWFVGFGCSVALLGLPAVPAAVAAPMGPDDPVLADEPPPK